MAPNSSSTGRRRITVVLLIVVGIASILLGPWLLPFRGVYIKAVNRTGQPMTGVQIVLGSGRRLALPPIPPGGSSGAYIRHAETRDIGLVYSGRDGTAIGQVRVGFSLVDNILCADKIIFGITAHPTNGDPRSLGYYIARRRRYDPAAYLPSGIGD